MNMNKVVEKKLIEVFERRRYHLPKLLITSYLTTYPFPSLIILSLKSSATILQQ